MNDRPENLAPRRDRWAVGWAALWFVGTTGLIAGLMAVHAFVLPAPALAAPEPTATPVWRARHLLAADCRCSAAVAAHLVERRALDDWAEEVWWIGPEDPEDWTSRLAAARFRVLRLTPDEAAQQHGIGGAPWLRAHHPSGQVRYDGGYAARRPRPGVPLDDVAILTALRVGQAVEARPALGCATSAELQRSVDPLGLKYTPNPSRRP